MNIQLTCYCIYTLSIVPLLQACLLSLQGSWQLNCVPMFVSSVRTNLCHVIACSICSYWVVRSPYQKFHHVNDVAEGLTPATHAIVGMWYCVSCTTVLGGAGWEGWVGGCGKVGEWVGSRVGGRVWVWEGGQVLYVHEFAVNCLSPSLVSVHT